MKIHLYMAALLAATVAWTGSNTPSSTNLAVRGLGAAGAPPAGKVGGSLPVIMSALRGLVKAQHADGSWGEGEARQLSTALALCAILRNGAWSYRDVRDYGSVVTSAHQWLLASQPATDAERVATAVALSDYAAVHCGGPRLKGGGGPKPVPPEQLDKIRACLAALSPRCGEVWRDFLGVSRLPDEAGRGFDRTAFEAVLGKYQARGLDGSPSTLEQYLGLYLTAVSRSYYGGRRLSEWSREFRPAMAKLQGGDSLFPCADARERVSATGLSVMSLTVFNLTFRQFRADAPPGRDAAGER